MDVLEFRKCKIINFFRAEDKKWDRHKSKGNWGQFKGDESIQSFGRSGFRQTVKNLLTQFALCTIRWRLMDQSFKICKSFCHPGPWGVDAQDSQTSEALWPNSSCCTFLTIKWGCRLRSIDSANTIVLSYFHTNILTSSLLITYPPFLWVATVRSLLLGRCILAW